MRYTDATFRALAGIAIATALFAGGCAGPAKLAKQSEESLAKGDLHKAYDRALKAVEKDPQNGPAREAYGDASRAVARDYSQRVLATASADTLRAADLALAFRSFRAEVAQHGSAIVGDGDYDSAEARIVRAAARRWYGRGRLALAAKHPKEAWNDFATCRRYDDGFLDAAKQMDVAYRLARTRVLIVPFADGIRIRGLAQDVCDRVTARIAERAGNDFRFTQLVPADSVENALTVGDSRAMTRESALALARKLGAQRVVFGHLAGLRSSTNQQEFVTPIYRKRASKDSEGNSVVRWEELSLRLWIRDRDVNVTYDLDVLDVRSGTPLAHREQTARTSARVAWSDYRPEGVVDDYALLPTEQRKASPDRARQADGAWQERMGTWTLPALLQRARDSREREHYAPEMRREFFTDTHRRPVWLGELPGEEELAFCALDDAWKPLLAALQELDAKD